jgi:hypothetical protein
VQVVVDPRCVIFGEFDLVAKFSGIDRQPANRAFRALARPSPDPSAAAYRQSSRFDGLPGQDATEAVMTAGFPGFDIARAHG